MGEVILTMKGIDKSFPGVHALDHVDLEIRKVKCSPHGRKRSRKIHSYEGADRYL